MAEPATRDSKIDPSMPAATPHNVFVPVSEASYESAQRIIDSNFDIKVVRRMQTEALQFLNRCNK